MHAAATCILDPVHRKRRNGLYAQNLHTSFSHEAQEGKTAFFAVSQFLGHPQTRPCPRWRPQDSRLSPQGATSGT
jgi:hypothetical protein